MREQALRVLADHDLARIGPLLQSSRNGHGAAGDERLLGGEAGREDLAALEPRADAEADVELTDQHVAQRGDRGLDLDGGARGAKRVVLVADRDPECGHDRIPGEPLDGSPVPRDDGRDRVEVAAHHAVQRFRVETLDERRRVGEVHEEDRRELALVHRLRSIGCNLERRRRHELRVLAEDRGLELTQLGTGLDAELVDEQPAGRLVGGQRVGLSARAIEREHELRTRPFPQRLGRDQGLELTHEVRVPAECQLRLDPVLERAQPELFELRYVGLRERLIDEVRDRRPAPEGESLAEHHRATNVVALEHGSAALVHQPTEAMNVHLLRLDVEQIARLRRDEDPARIAIPPSRVERLSQLRDVDLDGVPGGPGRLLAPEIVDQAVGRDDLA